MEPARYLYELTYTRRRVAEMPAPLDSPEAAYLLLRRLFDGAESERLVVVLLNRKHQPIGVSTVYHGTVCGMTVRIAELFREAVRTNAAAILIAHNHPSGDPAPSTADLRITKEAVAAGQLLGIEVLDHIVIGDGRWERVDGGPWIARAAIEG